MAAPFIGSQISLISASNIRYRGTLTAIDPVAATLTLTNVTSLGTEGRQADPSREIPAGKDVYEYVLFKASEVKDISIEQQPPAAPAAQAPQDPAILTTTAPPQARPPAQQPQARPPPQQPLAPQQQQQQQRTPAQQAHPQPSAPIQPKFAQYVHPGHMPYQPGQPQTATMRPSQPAPPLQQSRPNGSARGPLPAQPTPANQAAPAPTPVVPPAPRTMAQIAAGVKASPAAPAVPRAATAANVGPPIESLASGVGQMTMQDQSAAQRQQRAPQQDPGTGRGRGRGRGRGHPGIGAEATNGRGGGSRRAPQAPARPVDVPATEFDFQESNAKFSKDAAPDLVTIPADETFYDKKSSFFDDISTEIKERAINNEQRFDRNAERNKNLNTFGEAGVANRGRRGGFRGRGARGRAAAIVRQ
ncbi:hypothetical protein E5Q_02044 [Mixia osmundae IAM 14324]|uniref:DFDF domain-containing protein n=1 Tax=Mixia osmundae (strain CBS 9802 / IAM 14324 / JCM 22182 / KY 12970) TaxID=764103 RepID=G7DXT0_MIXOS|nr:hypothetical protein E5Q_02044 [Mixia osmundae IAM 14324]